VLIIETGVPPRWYIPPGDVRWDRLTHSPHHLPVQGPGSLLDGRRHRTALVGVELPRTATRDREPVGLIGIPDDDPAVQLLINDAPAHHKNAG